MPTYHAQDDSFGIEDAEGVIPYWQKDVFMFSEDALGMLPAEPLDELKGLKIAYEDGMGNKRETVLFNKDGYLTHWDLDFYTMDMFKNQDRESFKQYDGTRFTWQQTVKLTAYNRALSTFDKDSFDTTWRWITTRSGHGVGKTASTAVIAIHFLLCFPGAQIGMTSNSEQQVEDIFMKEFGKWRMKLPEDMRESLVMTSDHVRVENSEDWFLRALVARPEKPEAQAGLHGEYVLIIVDEASAVPDSVIEVLKGALTGDNFIFLMDSNPTRNEGYFFESQKKGSRYTKLHFSTRHSPIVKLGYIDQMEADYPSNGEEASDEVKIRVDGEFAGVAEMDEQGWIPLFANLNVLFEPEQGQIINRAVIGVDPAGKGRDSSVIVVRDNVYLKEVLNEKTSSAPDLARKVESVRDAYNSTSNDIGVDAFGVGAQVVANIGTKMGESVNAILMDKPREETKLLYANYKAELAWKFRQWVQDGGIIITNKKKAWLKEMDKIKYKRTGMGQIMMMPKPMFKKLNGFSPDRFDAGIISFFRDDPVRPVILTKDQLETQEMAEFMKRVSDANKVKDWNQSSM
jgi:hypothetical protein